MVLKGDIDKFVFTSTLRMVKDLYQHIEAVKEHVDWDNTMVGDVVAEGQKFISTVQSMEGKAKKKRKRARTIPIDVLPTVFESAS